MEFFKDEILKVEFENPFLKQQPQKLDTPITGQY
jgi:hypothetical protein